MDIYHPTVMPRKWHEIPQEFRKIWRKLSQDEPYPHYGSHEELMKYLIADLDSRERRVAKDYINSLFALNLSDRELLTVSCRAGSDLKILGEEGVVKEFFGMLSSALESQ
jgi:hypothetical protein